MTPDYRTSRALSAAALGTIAGDFGLKFAADPRATHLLVGAAMYTIPTARTLAILLVPRLDRDRGPRVALCAAAGVLQLVFAVGADIAATAPVNLLALIPLAVIALAAVGDVSNEMRTRRRFIFVIGCLSGIFAFETSAWGLLAKAAISDVAASVWVMLWGPIGSQRLVRNPRR